MKKPVARIITFALLLPAIQFVSLWLILAFVTIMTPPDIILQAFLALPLFLLMQYKVPRWLYSVLVTKPAGCKAPPQSLVFVSSTIVFFVCILLLAVGTYAGFITQVEGLALFYFGSFIILLPIVLKSWDQPNIRQ